MAADSSIELYQALQIPFDVSETPMYRGLEHRGDELLIRIQQLGGHQSLVLTFKEIILFRLSEEGMRSSDLMRAQWERASTNKLIYKVGNSALVKWVALQDATLSPDLLQQMHHFFVASQCELVDVLCWHSPELRLLST